MKKLVSLLIVAFIAFFSMSPIYAANEIELNSQYAYLYDRDTSLVYLDIKSEEKIYPASMTKILTASLALDKITNIYQQVIITADDLKGLAEEGASVAGFYVGETVTYEDLLYGTLLPSGADACNALARLLYGSVNQMVEAMNQKIQSLGLKNTHFQDVTGLHDEEHYTTVKDMAMILNQALDNETFEKVFTSKQHLDSKGKRTWTSTLQRAKDLKNIDTPHIDGAKSGYTDAAQLTLASTMTLEGHQFILVTAKAKGQRTQNHVKDANTVYDYLADHFQKFIIYKKDEDMGSCFILKSFEGFYDIQSEKEISIIVDKTIKQDDISVAYDGDKIVEAPLEKGQKIGSVIVKYQDQVLYQYQVTLPQTIESPIMAIVLHYGFIVGVIGGLGCIVYRVIKKKAKH